MRSPTAALLWDIWRRKRGLAWAIAGLTAFSWLVGSVESADQVASGSGQPTLLNQLLGMLSFLLLFGVFSYTESGADQGVGRFPHRLFTLPVSSLRLTAVPVLAGIASIELLYLLWMDRLSRGEPTSALFTGVLLAAFMVFSQAALWTLARIGPLRLVVLGAVAFALFAIGLLPSFPASGPSAWRSEAALSSLVAVLAAVAFGLAWRHVAGLRSGGGHRGNLFALLTARTAGAVPRGRRPFPSPERAHFWFEWRCSGMALPALVGGVLLALIGPLSWMARHDGGDTMRLLLGTLATPILLAVPVGVAFSRPTLWSDDLSVPAFVAVRPMSEEDMVATKVKVAVVAVAISWLAVLAFVGVWLSWWANLDSVRRLAIPLRAVGLDSVYPASGIAALIVIGAMLLTWRFMVSRLWSGLSGNRALFLASTASIALVAIALAVSDAGRLPGWILEDPDRVTSVAWIGALAVAAKLSFAAYAWRRVAPRHIRRYLLVWLAGTACFVTLAVLLWHIVRVNLPVDFYRVQTVLILVALLAVPLGRLGLAPSRLARNRHR